MSSPHMSVVDLTPSARRSAREVRAHWLLYAAIGALTLAVLAYGVVEQLFDTNFYVLWEATALLAGDHPYRDFYQMGWPLLTLMSTAVQWAVGYRLIGEFAIHWTFIVASILIGFHLALRLSRSVWASVVTTLIAIAIVGATPTFQFPKLFFYPVAVWVSWWYLARPSMQRAAAIGAVTAVSFLYRHDHGLYIGVGAMLAFALARLVHPAARQWRTSAAEIAVFAGVAILVLLPWAVLVERNEGMVDYVRTRAAWGRTWAPDRMPYFALRDVNPATVLAAGGLPGRAAAEHWLLQITLLLPLLVIIRAAIESVAEQAGHRRSATERCEAVIAAAVVILVGMRLFREDGYFTVVLPLSAALGAQLLAAPGQQARAAWRVAQRALAVGVAITTSVAAAGYAASWDLFEPGERSELRPAFTQLLTTPPIDAIEPADRARQMQPAEWLSSDADRRQRFAFRYMHDCTRNGDRIFVTGSTPYQVGYYTERPMAGGHVQWHHGWRSDPVHARQSLQLLETQSVPFAFSTHDPVLADLQKYPDIQRYFQRNYVEVEGSGGLLLIDRRRQPTSRFGALGLPCFG